MKIAEIRHLDGIKSNFMVSEGEYLAPAASQVIYGCVASQIIYSNEKEIVSSSNMSLTLYGIKQYQPK